MKCKNKDDPCGNENLSGVMCGINYQNKVVEEEVSSRVVEEKMCEDSHENCKADNWDQVEENVHCFDEDTLDSL